MIINDFLIQLQKKTILHVVSISANLFNHIYGY